MIPPRETEFLASIHGLDGKGPRILGSWTTGLVLLLLSGYALSITPLFTVGPLLALGGCVLSFVFVVGTGRMLVNWRDPRVWVWAVILFGILISAVYDRAGSPLNSAIAQAAYVTFGLLLTYAIDRRVFLKAFTSVMEWVAVIGTVATVAIAFVGLNVPLALVQNNNGVVYRNGLAFFLIDIAGAPLPRAMGVFWEPGLFASFLLIACLGELFLVDRAPDWRRISIYIVAILCTQSTAAYLLLVPLVVIFLVRRPGPKSGLVFAAFAAATIVIYLNVNQILATLVAYQPAVFGKIDDGGLFSETRWNAVLLNLSLFASSPFVGLGLGGATEAFRGSMGAGIRAQTSTSGFLLAALGVAGSAYSVGWIWGTWRLKHLSLYARAGIALVLLVIVNKEPHTTLVFTYCLLFYLLSWDRADEADGRSVPRRVQRIQMEGHTTTRGLPRYGIRQPTCPSDGQMKAYVAAGAQPKRA